MTNLKWVRRKNGSWELIDRNHHDMLMAVVEPSRYRGNWWWTTWGNPLGDVGGYVFNIQAAKQAAMKKVQEHP